MDTQETTTLNPRVMQLVARWQAERRNGVGPSPTELCIDCPELEKDVRTKILELIQIEQTGNLSFALGATDGGSPAPIDPTQIAVLGALENATPLPKYIGTYRILRRLGEGGVGFVYLADDPALNRKVAIKVLKPEVANDPISCERFVREAQSVAGLQSDFILPVWNVGLHEGRHYFVMPFLKGETLDERLKRETKQSVPFLMRIAREIAMGLSVAHAKGVLHRDIKPANIWLEFETPDQQPRTKIIDFGLARSIHNSDHQLTQTGIVMGTPAFMSPEQAQGNSVDARSDLFALGVMMYMMATGRQPFIRPTITAILVAIAEYQPESPILLRREIPLGLSDLIMQLMAKRADNRPPSAEAVIQRLDNIEAEMRMAEERRKAGAGSNNNGGLMTVIFLCSALFVTVVLLYYTITNFSTIFPPSKPAVKEEAPLPKANFVP